MADSLPILGESLPYIALHPQGRTHRGRICRSVSGRVSWNSLAQEDRTLFHNAGRAESCSLGQCVDKDIPRHWSSTRYAQRSYIQAFYACENGERKCVRQLGSLGSERWVAKKKKGGCQSKKDGEMGQRGQSLQVVFVQKLALFPLLA